MIILAWKPSALFQQTFKLTYKNADITFEIDFTKCHEYLCKYLNPLITLTF